MVNRFEREKNKDAVQVWLRTYLGGGWRIKKPWYRKIPPNKEKNIYGYDVKEQIIFYKQSLKS